MHVQTTHPGEKKTRTNINLPETAIVTGATLVTLAEATSLDRREIMDLHVDDETSRYCFITTKDLDEQHLVGLGQVTTGGTWSASLR